MGVRLEVGVKDDTWFLLFQRRALQFSDENRQDWGGMLVMRSNLDMLSWRDL